MGAAEMGKGSLEYCRVVDKPKAEREPDLATDVPLWKCETSKYYVTITGAPGHRDLTNNAIAGPSRAECTVLTVAVTASLEAAAPGAGGPVSCPWRTRGARNNELLVSKWMPPSRATARRNTRTSLRKTAATARTLAATLTAASMPISGRNGDNVLGPSANMPWLKGWKVTRQDGSASGPGCWKLWIASCANSCDWHALVPAPPGWLQNWWHWHCPCGPLGECCSPAWRGSCLSSGPRYS